MARDTRALRDFVSSLHSNSGVPVFLVGENEASGHTQRGPDGPDTIAFVAGRASRQEFDEPTPKRRFEDLGWPEGVARASARLPDLVGAPKPAGPRPALADLGSVVLAVLFLLVYAVGLAF